MKTHTVRQNVEEQPSRKEMKRHHTEACKQTRAVVKEEKQNNQRTRPNKLRKGNW